jgi:CO dehydrogenase maturation factor
MRVAFVGKGGAGKSTAVGILARLLARRGEPVLALDSDPMPGLAFSLGMPRVDAGIPDEAVVPNPAGGRPPLLLRPGLDAAGAVEAYAARGPDGVRLLQLGKFRGRTGEHHRSHWAYQQILDQLPVEHGHVIGDLPGGTKQPFMGWGRFARLVVVVAEPVPTSMLTARRLSRVAALRSAPRVMVLASRTRQPGDGALVARRTGLPLVGEVPADEQVAAAERAGLAPLDAAPDAPAVAAVGHVLDRLLDEWSRLPEPATVLEVSS